MVLYLFLSFSSYLNKHQRFRYRTLLKNDGFNSKIKLTKIEQVLENFIFIFKQKKKKKFNAKKIIGFDRLICYFHFLNLIFFSLLKRKILNL